MNNKVRRLLKAVFFAMGHMFSPLSREDLRRANMDPEERDPVRRIAGHFEATWGYIGKAADNVSRDPSVHDPSRPAKNL